jgi:WD40 repeat protein
VAIVRWERPVEVRDAVTLAPVETIGAGRRIIDFAFGPRPDLVAYCENGKVAVIEDGRAGKRHVLDAVNSQPDVVFSPDGALLATGGYGTAARLWRVDDGALLRVFDLPTTAGGLRPAFSPDGKLLAVGNRNDVTCVFDVATGAHRYTLPKPSTQEIRFSPKGDRLAAAYVDGSLALWRAEDGELVASRQTPAEEVYTLDWSPDGSLLASAGLKGPLLFWDPRDLTLVRALPAPEWVVGVNFSPDGMSLSTAGGAGVIGGPRLIQVWAVEGSLFSLLHRPR